MEFQEKSLSIKEQGGNHRESEGESNYRTWYIG